MEWLIYRSRQILPCISSIQEHAFSTGWTVPNPKALWVLYPRHPCCPSSIILTRMVTELKQAKTTQQSMTTYYNAHVHPLVEIGVGFNVVIQNTHTKLWDIYGIITDISPNRRYCVKTSSGCVLVRN